MVSVVTPSYNQLDWLRLAIASIADQEQLEYEHIIQDGGTSGIEEFLSSHFGELIVKQRLKIFVEKDAGMYDAINRGLAKSGGEICAYLNCDEQYLPGALSQIAAAFASNPSLDVLLAGSLVVDNRGRYICSRPALKPSLRHLRAGRMYNLTSSIFFRAHLIRDHGILFDPSLRIVGDREWLRRVVESGAQIQTLNVMTSTFSDLGTNLALSAEGSTECDPAQGSGATWQGRLLAAEAVASHRLRRLLAGQYHQRPFTYSIYTLSHPDQRQTFQVEKPTGVWRNRL